MLLFFITLLTIFVLFLDPAENYDADFDNPGCHGDYLLSISVNEKVDRGRKQVSSVVIVRPNTHPAEIPFLKAVQSTDEIKITSLAHPSSYLENQAQWMEKLENNKKHFQASTLVTTLNSMMTKIARINKPKPQLKTTTISLKKANIALSTDYFANEDGTLTMLPLPFECDTEIAGEKYKSIQSVVVWRAYINDTEDAVLDEDANVKTDDNMSMLEKLMKGTKIS